MGNGLGLALVAGAAHVPGIVVNQFIQQGVMVQPRNLGRLFLVMVGMQELLLSLRVHVMLIDVAEEGLLLTRRHWSEYLSFVFQVICRRRTVDFISS